MEHPCHRWVAEVENGKVVGTELADCMLVALLVIACSNNGADGELVVGLDLQLVTFHTRSFRIVGSGIDKVGGNAATLIAMNTIQHTLFLIDGGDGSVALKCVIFSDGRTAYVFQKGHN